jgi:thiamine biosynthesis lipoprotein
VSDARLPRRVLIPLALAAEPPALGGAVHEFSGATMGTTWSVRLVASPRLQRAPVQAAIQAELDDVVAQMSSWAPDSDLGRFNRAAPRSWHVLPPAFFEVLARGVDVARASDGAFDPAAGALVDAWGFGATRGPRTTPPTPAALARARAAGGWQRLELDAARGAAFQPGGLALDLSAIAKGHGVDRVAARLAALGMEAHLVEVGGELRGAGVKPDGRPWWVALEHPEPDAQQVETLVALHGLSVATSGDYRRWFAHEGTRYSHTIDPRDGRPIRHGLASVTVLHADCIGADAWSTALNVMGADAGLAYADERGLAALFIARVGDAFEERASAALEALLQ